MNNHGSPEENFLVRVKSARKMEREAKDMFGRYLSAINQVQGDDDIDVVEVLEQKMEALNYAEEEVRSE